MLPRTLPCSVRVSRAMGDRPSSPFHHRKRGRLRYKAPSVQIGWMLREQWPQSAPRPHEVPGTFRSSYQLGGDLLLQPLTHTIKASDFHPSSVAIS